MTEALYVQLYVYIYIHGHIYMCINVIICINRKGAFSNELTVRIKALIGKTTVTVEKKELHSE